jgi:hypothetical protein
VTRTDGVPEPRAPGADSGEEPRPGGHGDGGGGSVSLERGGGGRRGRRMCESKWTGGAGRRRRHPAVCEGKRGVSANAAGILQDSI